ncbi:hypothetical protein PT974_07285 [Cladobotryum mycophilum]|uniref:Uncharacterized protein n=1 Tax=Cladobotryum mycophilum TaxID=491253 RepID=A0ABR0SP21_9HYPO
MRFFKLFILLPTLTIASPGGNHQLKELPDIGAVALVSGISLYDLPHGKGGSGLQPRQAICPPDYPLSCKAYGFCCPPIAVGCCPLACCAPGSTFCQNGHCYGPVKKT